MFLPDGRRFLYAEGQQTKAGRWTIRMGSLDSDRVEDVIEGDSNAAYANGSLIFARNGMLVAQPVDERSLRPTGDPVPLAENVLHDAVLGRAVFSASERGTLVYQVGSAVAGSRLVWLDRTCKEVGVLADTCLCIWSCLSPDARAAVAVTDASTGNGDIWIHEIADGRRSHLTFEEALEAKSRNGLRTAAVSSSLPHAEDSEIFIGRMRSEADCRSHCSSPTGIRRCTRCPPMGVGSCCLGIRYFGSYR